VVALTDDRNSQVRRLSGGQRRRLDLALALAGDPDLIFLDEPTTGFDPESRRRCWAAIENLRRLGKTIVLTTHYLDEAERLADRLAILQAGRIQVTGTVQQVARQASVPTKISFTTPGRVRDGSLRFPSCLDVAVTGEVATCVTGHTATALRELLAWAAANDLGDLDDLSVDNPTLEDAYMQLVCGGAE
jgi:ABC-2 type transport system ATP-binding protein